MIKKVFLYCTLCYFLLPLLIGLLTVGVPEWAALGCLAIGAVIVASVGLFIGVFLSAVYQRPEREIWYYLIGQFIPVAALITVFILASNSEPKKESNSASNEKYVFELYKDMPAMGVAYDSLKARFRTPDDFLIEFTVSHGMDTLIHFQRDSLWVIYFAYALEKGPAKERYAKYFVFDNVATMSEFNLSQSNQEFSKIANATKGAKQLLDEADKLK